MIRRPPRSTLFSLHDALPISPEDFARGLVEVDVAVRDAEAHHLHRLAQPREVLLQAKAVELLVGLVPVRPEPLEDVGPVEHGGAVRSEEHTSELQSRLHLVCRLLLEKKKQKTNNTTTTHQSCS